MSRKSAKSFFEVLFRLKDVIFITASKRQRNLRQCTARASACKGRTCIAKVLPLQAEVVLAHPQKLWRPHNFSNNFYQKYCLHL
jgi:hypothetical protein